MAWFRIWKRPAIQFRPVSGGDLGRGRVSWRHPARVTRRSAHAVVAQPALELVVGAARLLRRSAARACWSSPAISRLKAARKTSRFVHASERATTAGTRSSGALPVSSAITGVSTAASRSQPMNSRSRRACAAGHEPRDRHDPRILAELDAGDELFRLPAERLHERGAGRAGADRVDERVAAVLALVEDEVLLGREVVEDRLLGDVGRARDVGDGHGVVAVLGNRAIAGPAIVSRVARFLRSRNPS